MSNPPLSPDQKNEKPVALKEIDVATLVGGSREAILVHRGERYRLRITANGKLILTK
ncbi:hemin uptake protein HemP [Microvirga flavescens]|uniref:hemin uptake protein HemP n=1 Tax=Microvirga flavescens TaxID=2249811 RepID=UPI001FDEC3F4|nr:hemin uptake protein HemP [Microvirga flavescens]